MVTPQSTVRVPSENSSAAVSWRAVATWFAFAAVLATGLVLAARLGGNAPVMIEDFLR